MADLEDDEFYRLLLRAAPDDDTGKPTIRTLASALGMSRWGVYKWIKTRRIRPSRAKQVVEIGNGRVKLEEFEPFIYNI